MTLAEKLHEIEEKFITWIGIYSRKELVPTPARIVAEAICKAIILSKRPHNGVTIIDGDDPAVPSAARRNKSVGERLELDDLIKAVYDIGGFRNAKRIYTYLQSVKGLSNNGSHSTSSQAEELTHEDLHVIHTSLLEVLKWLYVVLLNRKLPDVVQDALKNRGLVDVESSDLVAWNTFLSACHDFHQRRQYILVSPPNLTNDPTVAASIARLPWRLTIDFDRDTDTVESGLLASFNRQKGTTYKRSFTIDDKPEFEIKFDHYWFHANGLGSIGPSSDFKAWRRRYNHYLQDKLYTAFVKGSSMLPRTVVLINIDPDYADAVIAAIEYVDERNVDFVLCNDGTKDFEAVLKKFENVSEVNISIGQLSRGVEIDPTFSADSSTERSIKIPYKNSIQVLSTAQIKPEDYEHLYSLGIEIIYKGIENDIDSDIPLDEFYKGATVNWQDLASNRDVVRYGYKSIRDGLLADLEKNKPKEIEFIHEPGAGGTTLSRRLAFDLCSKYPTVCLRKYEPKKTLHGLRVIYDKYINSSIPILIIIEHHEVKDAHSLYRDLNNVSKNAVLFIVKRGKVTTASDKRFVLRASLLMPEIANFEDVFSSHAPSRRGKIVDIKNEYKNDQRFISPFLYGLVAYEHAFIGIDDYIEKCITDLNIQKRQLVGFVCLIYHFTQQAVPGEFFSNLFGVPSDKCDLMALLGEDSPVFDILQENFDGRDGKNTWRPRYAIIGEEAMKIVLTGSPKNKAAWKAYLGTWLIELIRYFNGAMPVIHDDAKSIFDSLFITREDYDGTLGRDQFTDAIQELLPEVGEAVFSELTSAYPDEAHYHGHFARYLYKPEIGLHKFDRAIQEAKLSLEIQENDPSLVHTMGMCYKEKADEKMNGVNLEMDDLNDQEYTVKELVELACEAFDRSIALDGYNVYGHVTQSQLLLRALEFGFKITGSKTREVFLTDPSNEWYASILEKVGTLLEEAVYIIDQSKGLELKARLLRSAQYIERCEADYLAKIGNAGIVKSKYDVLIKQPPAGHQNMIPRYKTLFIRSLLASKSESISGYSQAWDKLTQSELETCVEYLRQNIVHEPFNSNHFRMWLQAARHLKYPPSLEDAITIVGTWCQIEKQTRNLELEGLYYLYVLNAVKAIDEGAEFDRSSVSKVKEIRDRLRFYSKNEKFSFEWYGNGNGLHKLKNHRTLGTFGTAMFFTQNAGDLVEVFGRIKEASDWQRGKIELDCGLEAFFVPGIGAFSERNVNDRVKFFIGFRYDQINAWDVTPVDYDREVRAADDLEDEVDASDEEVFTKFIPAAPKKEEPTVTSLKQDLPGLKVLGKIELGSLPAKAQNEKKKNSIQPKEGEFYIGNIDRVKQPIGVIKSDGFGQYIKFHVSALRNLPFHKLKRTDPVQFRIRFENGAPKIDKDGQSYLALEVKPL